MIKIKATPSVLGLAFASLLAASSALPFVFNQIVASQTEPNAPRTFLGLPYRICRGSRGGPQPCLTLLVTNHDDSEANANARTDSKPYPDLERAFHQAQGSSNAGAQTETHKEPCVPLPVSPVLNAWNVPEFTPGRLRLIKLKRPWRDSHGPDAPPLHLQEQNEENTLGSRDAQHALLPLDPRPERTMDSHEASVPDRHLKRLYDRGEWKSRLVKGH